MPRRRDERARVIGPTWLPSKHYWRVTTIDPQQIDPRDRRRDRYFSDEAEAKEYRNLKAAALERLAGVTLEAAIDLYAEHVKEKGTSEVSRKETLRRLRAFFSERRQPIARITHERAAKLYVERDADGKIIGGFVKGRSVDYHRNALAEVRTFARWWIDQGWVSESPFEKVKGIGKRRAGKLQPTGDEAHRILFAALWMAWGGDLGALGCAMALTMALRQKDVSRRQVRDVDLGGTQLRVEGGKTAKSNRPRKVPAILQPLLRQLAAGRTPFEPLFKAETSSGYHTKSWLRAAMKRVCKAAGAPYVCPHALKGTAGSVLAETGELADRIADHLSHKHKATSERHYIADGAVEAAQAERGLMVIQGGRR